MNTWLPFGYWCWPKDHLKWFACVPFWLSLINCLINCRLIQSLFIYYVFIHVHAHAFYSITNTTTANIIKQSNSWCDNPLICRNKNCFFVFVFIFIFVHALWVFHNKEIYEQNSNTFYPNMWPIMACVQIMHLDWPCAC